MWGEKWVPIKFKIDIISDCLSYNTSWILPSDSRKSDLSLFDNVIGIYDTEYTLSNLKNQFDSALTRKFRGKVISFINEPLVYTSRTKYYTVFYIRDSYHYVL